MSQASGSAPPRAGGRLPGPERRKQLLDVALDVFGVGGYSEASMSDIAAAAGVTKPVVYQHFPSKRALFLEVLDECGRSMQTAVEKATSNAGSGREQVEQGFRAFVGFFEERPAAFRVLFSDVSRSDPEFAAKGRAVELAVAERITDLITVENLSAPERSVLAHGIVGLAEGACRHWMDHETAIDTERVSRLLANLAWSGLRGAGA